MISAPLTSSILEECEYALSSSAAINDWEKLYLGFDLGTTNLVLVALNEKGMPVSAVLEPSGSSVRDGVIVDYMASLRGMRTCLDKLARKLGTNELPGIGAAAYPPGINTKTAKVCANVVESLGYDCKGLYEEPSAAAMAMDLQEGVIVDIGGGTTGISILHDGDVVYTADEPTGGTHMTLVLAGSMGISFEEAEIVKRDPAKQQDLVPLLKPVLEKMAFIVHQKLEEAGYTGDSPVILVGGGADLPGSEEIMAPVIGYPVSKAPQPLLVTPLGIAMSLWRDMN
jgi:ethanolamine utilization protein EutJ